MAKNLYEEGLAMRRRVLGDEYVDAALASVDDFSKPFQQFVTAWGWGALWTRDGLSLRQRSLVTVGIVCALNRPFELKIHLRGAIRNGCTKEEIREVLLQATVYAGGPAGVDGFKIAREVLAEEAKKPRPVKFSRKRTKKS